MLTLVFALLFTSQADAGVREAKKAALEQPLDPAVWSELGAAYDKKGRNRAALRAYGRAVALDPEHATAIAAMAELSTGRVQALERRALRNPEDDELWGDLADKYAAMGDDTQALKYYLYALRLDPSDSEWQGGIANVGGPEAMAEAMEAMIESGIANDETIGDLADISFASGDVERACELWVAAQERDPADAEWTDALAMNCGIGIVGVDEGGGYYPGIGEFDGPGVEGWVEYGGEPMPDMPTGIDIRSAGDAELLVAMARTKLLAGDKSGSLDLYERALTIDPINADGLHAVMVITGQTRLDLLQRLIDQVPPNDELYGELGDTALAAGHLARARAAYEEALRLDPSDNEWQQKLLIVRVDEGGTVDLSVE